MLYVVNSYCTGRIAQVEILLDGYNIRCQYTYVRAKLVNHDKEINLDGSILETKIWQVPRSSRYPNGYKYSLVYIQNGERMVGYDNAEGKGDHKHLLNHEEPYTFANLDQLLTDFLTDIEKLRGKPL